MRYPFIRTILAAGSLAALCHAQDRWDQVDFKSASISGLHIYGVSVFSGYTSLSLPYNSLQVAIPDTSNLGSAITYGGELSLGWRRQREKSSFTALYSGSYNGQSRFSNLNAFGHNLSLSASRTIGAKWSLNLSGTAAYTTLAQYLYQPSGLSTISQTPSTFNDLAAVFAIGTFSDMQVASMLTGTPITPSTAGQGVLLGDRILTYAVQASASYAVSSRLSVNFSSFTAGGQSNFDNAPSYTTPRTIGATAGAALSYSLSPRTTIGLSLNETRASNRYQGSYGTNAALSLGRKMGPHWFLNGGVGMGYVNVTEQISGAAASKTITGNGSLGYRAYAHTFIVTYNRGTYDSYGLAAGVNTVADGAWNWHSPGSGWTLMASFGRQQLRDTGFMAISGWQANAGISRRILPQVFIRAEYGYLESSGSFLGTALDRAVHTARASLSWSPQASAR